MNWPQIVWIALATGSISIHLAKHREPCTDSYNVWIELFCMLFEAFLLWKGGFWGVKKWQIV